jgi:long-chain acyl-CoA synthetase
MENIWLQSYDKEVPQTIAYPDVTMYELFRQAVEKNPRGKATSFIGAKITYQALNGLVDRFADRLAWLGVKPGDRVALIMPNFPAYPVAHFATMKLGAILVPTNPLYVERELAYQLDDAGAETVVILDKLLPRLLQVKDKTPVRRVVVTQIKDFLPPVIALLYGLKNKSQAATDESKSIYLYSDLMKKACHSVQTHPGSAKDTAILLYTGGTTGISKGAELTHRNIVVNVMQTRRWLWRIRDKQERLLCVLPFFHSYGMTTGLHLSVACQSTMVLLPRFELADVMKAIKKNRPTIFCGVPSMYNAVNHYPGVSPNDVGSIRLCMSGGSGLPGAVQDKFEALTGGKLVEGYGLSETSPVTHVNPISGRSKNGTIGIPLCDTDAKIVDPETRKPVPVGEAGELAVKGPQVMKGYWKMKEETERVMQDGWFYTGDIATMDGDGFFRIVDRKKDLIISAGMNIYPREVEEVLLQHSGVQDTAVIGVPSDVRDEVVKAFVVLKKGETVNKADLIHFCRDKLSKFKLPREIEFVADLPKSTVGKVLKRVLRDEEIKKREEKKTS